MSDDAERPILTAKVGHMYCAAYSEADLAASIAILKSGEPSIGWDMRIRGTDTRGEVTGLNRVTRIAFLKTPDGTVTLPWADLEYA